MSIVIRCKDMLGSLRRAFLPGKFSDTPRKTRRTNLLAVSIQGLLYLEVSLISTARYRLAPQFPFPCGLQDCLAAYLFLLTVQDPSHIILAGDSAGGGMVLRYVSYM